jgi:hypothetical protein
MPGIPHFEFGRSLPIVNRHIITWIQLISQLERTHDPAMLCFFCIDLSLCAPSPGESGEGSGRAEEGVGRKKSGRDGRKRWTRGILSPDSTNEASPVLDCFVTS